MTAFSPVAIVGRSCVLPGALSHAELWQALTERRDLLSRAPAGYWRVAPEEVLCSPEDWTEGKIWSDRGGYVQGFEDVFDATGFARPADDIRTLDVQIHWLLHTARQVLQALGIYGDGRPLRDRVGLIFGNLGYPTFALDAYAESLWTERLDEAPDPRNRFHPGLSGHYAAECLGLTGEAWCLDAACASSLYALKLACDRLHEGDADVMLAGAVNRCDDLMIHAGFCSLRALSPTGQSRPFHKRADGLVPAEGAAMFGLMRLEDALAGDMKILGVIRGIGLSNDGREGGFLSPSAAGQARALEQAYTASGIDPGEISYVECHATGTPGGDRTELETLASFFRAVPGIRIGSHKSNMGHLITAAGAAGLLKILSSFEHGLLAPDRRTDDLVPLAQTPPLAVVTRVEAWQTAAPRRAGLNAFGFGGTNAHLIVEEWRQQSGGTTSRPKAGAAGDAGGRAQVAVVGLAVRSGAAGDAHAFRRLLFGAATPGGGTAIDAIHVDLEQLSFPPRDLGDTLSQQILMLATALDAARGSTLPGAGTGVFVGASCDAETCRWTGATRLAARYPGAVAPGGTLAERHTAALVVGAMTNVAANRINFQLGLLGPGFTCFAEELSGIRALETAAAMIRRGALKAAIVGAVDLSVEEVHTAAARQVLSEDRQPPADAAVALVLKALDEARRDGDTIFAVLDDRRTPEESPSPVLHLSLDEQAPGLAPLLGHAHAASGLLLVAGAVLALHHRLLPTLKNEPAWPWLGFRAPRRAAVRAAALGGQRTTVRLREADPERDSIPDLYLTDIPRIHTFSGASREELDRLLQEDGSATKGGPLRLAFVATDREFETVKREAATSIRRGAGEPVPSGTSRVFLSEGPLGGGVALFCSSAAGVYRGQGCAAYRAFNDLTHTDRPEEEPGVRAGTAYTRWTDPFDAEGAAGPADRLAGARLLSRMHGLIATQVLDLRCDAALGLSSGESDMMFAICAADMNEALRQSETAMETHLFTQLLSGSFDCVRRAWGLAAEEAVDWSMWRLVGPSSRLEEALRHEPRTYVAIINAPGDFVLVGDRSACARVLQKVAPGSSFEIEGYELAYHVPAVRYGAADLLRAMYTREWALPTGTTIYSSAWAAPYAPSSESYAEAVVAQATQTVDLPALIQRAYEDGIRIFVEVGARNLGSNWIRQILGEKPHLAVSFDRHGVNSLRQIALAAAELFAAGVDLDIGSWNARMAELQDIAAKPAVSQLHERAFAAHRKPVVLAPEALSIMPPAPPLPPVFCPSEETFDLEMDASELPPGGAAPPRPARRNAGEPPRPAAAAPCEPCVHSSPLMASIARQSEIFLHYAKTAKEAHLEFLRLRARMRRSLLLGSAPARPEPAEDEEHASEQAEARAARASAPEPRALIPLAPRHPVGPSYDRDELVILAGGRISAVFGHMFERQDAYRRQTRLPEPPLLLVDRITGLEAEPGVQGTGTIWTETDVRPDAWYLHHGRMPAGIMVEAGQADLALISYMGIDFHNRDERVYRLLGCQLTYHRGLAHPGETLRYQIEVERHVQHGGVRIFFFNYDCTVDGHLVMSVRRGHAGFFTDAELARSDGVLWDSMTSACDAGARLDPPELDCSFAAFDEAQVQAFFEGRMFDCFGTGFERTLTHTRTPRPGAGRLRFFHSVPDFDPRGGPWGRGYLRARWRFSADDWFFPCHFKHDPCMPGTLMLEGAFQAMAFYLTASGYTVGRDGWRFEPVQGITFDLRCRGQATPESHQLDCELFVEEVHNGPEPTLFADVLGTVDGLKALYCRRLALKLVPDFPLNELPPPGSTDGSVRTAALDGIPLDYASLLHCAIGEPGRAFGTMADGLPHTGRCPRLPGPPYHFMSRITRLDTRPNHADIGGAIEAEYDIPPDAWYFRDGGNDAMPFSVLLETGLQPCGWLAACTGVPFSSSDDLYFRNLDGRGQVYREILPNAGTLTTRVELRDCSAFAGAVIVQFKIASTCAGQAVADWETSFGFFTHAALAQQVGLPDDVAASPGRSDRGERRPWRAFLADAAAPSFLWTQERRLDFFHHVTGYWPDGGRAGLGRLCAERQIDASDWYFKAHFYQDPVQPGSLGIEAMLQLVRALVMRKGLARDFKCPRFESVAAGAALQWTYRGQVTPENKTVAVDVELTRVEQDGTGLTAVAEASLWVDGLRIYKTHGLPIRILEPRNEGRVPSLTFPAER